MKKRLAKKIVKNRCRYPRLTVTKAIHKVITAAVKRERKNTAWQNISIVTNPELTEVKP